MGNLRKFKKGLQIDKVWLAEKVQHERIKLVQNMIEERVKKDVNFAKDVLKAVGDNLPPAIKKAAEESIANEGKEKPDESKAWASLPTDPLLEMGAPPSDYPENQGMVPFSEKV